MARPWRRSPPEHLYPTRSSDPFWTIRPRLDARTNRALSPQVAKRVRIDENRYSVIRAGIALADDLVMLRETVLYFPFELSI